MEVTIPQQETHKAAEHYFTVGGARMSFDDLCVKLCEPAGVSPQQYVELFWDEA